MTRPFDVYRRAFANPNLRKLLLAWAGSVTGDWAYVIALSVFAFERGGAPAVGLVWFIRMLPAAIAAPLISVAGDAHRRERIMLAADLVRAVATAAAAVAMILDLPAAVVYVLAGVVSVASAAFRPAQNALLPTLSRTPEELTATNAVSHAIGGFGAVMGALLGGILVVVATPPVVLLTRVVALLWSAFLVSKLDLPAQESRSRRVEEAGGLGRFLAGFRAIGTDRRVLFLLIPFAVQSLVRGALNVLVVVIAIRLLSLGHVGVGVLAGAIGLGSFLGGALTVGLVGRQGLGGTVALGALLVGFPLVLIGLVPQVGAAAFLLAVLGAGNAVSDAAGYTLLQRAVPEAVLARLLGVFESLITASIGLGAILAPVLIEALGARVALVVTGTIAVMLVIPTWLSLRRVDYIPASQELIALLQGSPLFAPLPTTVIEHLARNLAPRRVREGEEVVTQGGRGDLFFIIDSGTVEVLRDGGHVATLGSGQYFGEIALLRDIPRTASVRASSDANLYTLERDEFLAAVTGHAPTAEAADAAVATRLMDLRARVGSL